MFAFTGEIRAFPFSFAPVDWMLCNGQLLSVVQYQQLFAIIGDMYGGNAKTNFALPNIQGIALIGAGTLPGGDTYHPGNGGGIPEVTLASPAMPAHTHSFNGLVTTDQSGPVKGENMPSATSYLSNVFEVPPAVMKRQGNFYSSASPTATLNSQSVVPFPGKSGAHNNMQPCLVMTYCICVYGDWPSRP